MLELTCQPIINYSDLIVPSLKVLNLLYNLCLLNLQKVWVLELFSLRHNFGEVKHNVIYVDVAMQNVPLIQFIQPVGNITKDTLEFTLPELSISSRNDVVQGPTVDVLLHEYVLALILEKFYQCHTCAWVHLF